MVGLGGCVKHGVRVTAATCTSFITVVLILLNPPEHGTQTCDTVEIAGANIPSQHYRIGVPYSRSGELGGRPIFRSNGGDYIYPCNLIDIVHDVYYRWCVWSTMKNSSYEMFMASNVTHPAEGRAPWYIWVGHTFRPYPSVSVKCVEGKPESTTTAAMSTPYSHKPSSHTALILGVTAAAVVLVALFLVVFLVIWKKVREVKTQAGNPTATFNPEAANRGSSPEASRPLPGAPGYNYIVTAEATSTDYQDEGYLYLTVPKASPTRPETTYEQLVQ